MVIGKMGPFRLSYLVYVIHVKVHVHQAVVHSTFKTEITRWSYSELIAGSVVSGLVI